MTQGYLDEIERQLIEATERGVPERALRRRRRWRWELLGFVPAVAAAAAIIGIVVSSAAGPARPARVRALHSAEGPRTVPIPSSSHDPKTTSPITATATAAHSRSVPTVPRATVSPSGPVPAGFGPESFTAISELTWWLLGAAPCSRPPCTSIVRTNNGGASFVGIPAPRTTGVKQLRFADPSNGFAYGPELWVTHSAGAGWHQIDVQGTVTDLETAGGYVYAIVQDHHGSGRLLRSPVGVDDWITLSGEGNAFAGLWAYNRDVMLESGDGSSGRQELAISDDAGASFTKYPAPTSVVCAFEGIPPVIWAECPTGTMSGVWRSTDGGAHFRAAGGDSGRSGLPSEPNSAAFAVASPTTALYGYEQLYRTVDGGGSYSGVSGPLRITGWQYLGFTDATHGVAVGYTGTETTSHERLYYTTDAGQSFRLVRIGASSDARPGVKTTA